MNEEKKMGEIQVEEEIGTEIKGLTVEQISQKVKEAGGAIYGEYIDYKTATPSQIVDWFLDNQPVKNPTDIIRKWIFASIPCKICGRRPEEIVEPNESMYVISFLNYGTNPGRSIRFFCRDHAQILQDELASRGAEIITEEQRRELLSKLDFEYATPEELSTDSDRGE